MSRVFTHLSFNSSDNCVIDKTTQKDPKRKFLKEEEILSMLRQSEDNTKKKVKELEEECYKNKLQLEKITAILDIKDKSRLNNNDNDSINNDSISEDYKCIICLDNKKSHLLVPCNHLCLCDNCSSINMKSCPICRSDITSVVKVYF